MLVTKCAAAPVVLRWTRVVSGCGLASHTRHRCWYTWTALSDMNQAQPELVNTEHAIPVATMSTSGPTAVELQTLQGPHCGCHLLQTHKPKRMRQPGS
jgi:hypothetical protein